MQATIHTLDQDTGAGSVIFDDGRVRDFEPAALFGSGLRKLAVGQRVTLETTDSGPIQRMWVVGIGDDQTIS